MSYERRPIKYIPFDEMVAHLNDPLTRIKDSRMLEMYDSFAYCFQVLQPDGTILYTTVDHDSPIKVIDLYKLQYKNNPRNNPGLYGLLEEAVK